MLMQLICASFKVPFESRILRGFKDIRSVGQLRITAPLSSDLSVYSLC